MMLLPRDKQLCHIVLGLFLIMSSFMNVNLGGKFSFLKQTEQKVIININFDNLIFEFNFTF